ncbi:hypothetical protein [Caballeronia sp. HLA56]
MGHSAEGVFIWSFSDSAIKRWETKLRVVENNLKEAPQDDGELNRFLIALCNEGYLSRKGMRYEVTCSAFHSSAATAANKLNTDNAPVAVK